MHTRLRRLVAPAFSPRAADRLRPFMREVINGARRPVAPTGRADFAVDICEPYPIPIICELLGAPKEDWQLFSRWADRRAARSSTATCTRTSPIIIAAQDELDEYTPRPDRRAPHASRPTICSPTSSPPRRPATA